MRVQKRVWPVLVALIGVGGLLWGAWRMVQVPEVDGPGPDEIPDIDPAPGTQWARVKSLEVPVFEKFEGVVSAEGETQVRAPRGMRVAITRIHHEMGDWVKKGDPLISFHAESFERAIREAEEAGETEKVNRFRDWAENYNPICAPADGSVLELFRSVGDVPLDDGIPLLTMTDASGYTFKTWLPTALLVNSVPLGLAVTVNVEDIGEIKGKVVRHGSEDPREGPVGDPGASDLVVISLEAREGLEKDMRGEVLLENGTKQVALVPKEAVEWRGDLAVVRAGEDGEILERTLQIEGGQTRVHRMSVDGKDREFYRVAYGVFDGQGVIVPTN